MDDDDITMEEVLVDKNINHLNQDTTNILEKAKVARAQASSTMSVDIRKMINSPEYSDVVFLCKNGERVHASRLFLVARSPVFHRMLLNGMAESQLAEIPLENFSSDVLLPVMEFLYTASLQEYAPLDWRHAFEIIRAAKFFLLEGLELIAVDYLLSAATKVELEWTEDMEAAAKFLSITVEFTCILDGIVDLVGSHLVCTLQSSPWKPEHAQALTGEAFDFFLEKTRNEDANPMFSSLREVVRLKNIILWCACKEFASKEPETLDTVSLEVKTVLKQHLKLKSSKPKVRTSQELETYNRMKAALALSVNKYLPLVNLRRIPPQSLVHIFEPMDVIPTSAMMDAFRFHALRTSASGCTEDFFGWSTSSSTLHRFRTGDESVIRQTNPGIGFARYGFRIDNTGKSRSMNGK